jgi:hypothetical protein
VSVSVPLSVNGYPAAGSDPRLPFGVRDRCAYAGHTSSAADSIARHCLSPFGHVASDVIPSIELLGSVCCILLNRTAIFCSVNLLYFGQRDDCILLS